MAAGRHLQILDYKFCEKRLTNASGFLVNNLTGGGAGNIVWTTSPCVQLPSIAVAEGVQIDNFLASLGDANCWYRVLPDGTANGYLKAEGGKWIIGDIPTATIPDPLTVSTLNVNTTATIKDLTVTEDICFTNLASGSVVTPVGLSSGGCLIKQSGTTTSPLGVSVALYYETFSESTTNPANLGIANNGYAQIGNQISNVAGIAAIQDVFTIKIVSAGLYMLDWGGVFTQLSDRDVNLSLEKNGTTLIPGFGPGRIHTTPGAGVDWSAIGFTVLQLAANDLLKLKVSVSTGTANLTQAKLKLTRVSA